MGKAPPVSERMLGRVGISGGGRASVGLLDDVVFVIYVYPSFVWNTYCLVYRYGYMVSKETECLKCAEVGLVTSKDSVSLRQSRHHAVQSSFRG